MQMPNKKLTLIAGCVFPLLAHAEVLDKIAQPLDMWLHALLGIAIAFVGLRIHWVLFLVTIGYPVLWFASLLMDLHSFDLGPAIRAEAGPAYSVNAYAASAIWLTGVATMVIYKIHKHPVCRPNSK
jgi:hypothetical protein